MLWKTFFSVSIADRARTSACPPGGDGHFGAGAPVRQAVLLVCLYSALMNLFVPSTGSKWIPEAPFLIPAGETLGVSPVATRLACCCGDSTTNLIQPFFTIRLLAVMRVRFADILGCTAAESCAA